MFQLYKYITFKARDTCDIVTSKGRWRCVPLFSHLSKISDSVIRFMFYHPYWFWATEQRTSL